MVAVVKTGRSIRRTLNYNENKVKEGVAKIISAANYPMDVKQLSFKNKLNRLQKQAALNENVRRNSVHISLNFHPSEQLSKAHLQEIADSYMKKIGFGEQPYLVYEHFDAAHPHIHIVSVKVRSDGSRIDMHNIGRNQSKKARKEIDQAFGLKRAEDSRHEHQSYRPKAVNVKKALYGRTSTKNAIATVLDAVVDEYKYNSLGELNAVLSLYNVMADKGEEGSRMYRNKGLVYRILDEYGNKVGVPIKASDFHNKPTLSYLEERFTSKKAARQSDKARVKNAIDLALLKRPNQKLTDLINGLDKEGIDTIVRQNERGIIYGITYVDHQTKCVFNGSALAKQYSANGILERCGERKKPLPSEQDFVRQMRPATSPLQEQGSPLQSQPTENGADLLDTVLQPEHSSGYVPTDLPGKRRKRRKRGFTKRL